MDESTYPKVSDKRVDESWKEEIAREKAVDASKEREQSPPRYEEDRSEPATSELFTRFLSSLAVQALSALGEMPNPITGVVEENLEHAKYLIDTIGILEEKTRGNLSSEESQMIKESLHTLRVKFVTKSSAPATPADPQGSAGSHS